MERRSRALLGEGGLALLLLFPLANLGNFAFHAVASRVLGPPSYGELNSLLVLLLALAVPVTAVQVVMTREVVRRREEGASFSVLPTIGGAAAIAGLALAFMVAAAPLIGAYLRLGSLRSVVLLGVFFVPVVIGLVPKALLVADRRFGTLAGIVLGGVGVRLAVGTVLLQAGGGIPAAMVATVLGEAAATGALLVAIRSELVPRVAALRIRWRDGWSASAAFVGFWLLAGVDVLAARHYLPFESSGHYAAAATLARAVLFLPQAVALVAFPRLAVRDDDEARASLRRAVVVTTVSAAAAALALVATHRVALPLLLGTGFSVSTGVIGLVALASCALALVNLFVQYELARGRRPATLVWSAVAVAIVLTAVWHGSAVAVAAGYLMVAAGLVTILVFRTRPEPVVERRSPRPALAGTGELDLSVVVPFYNPGRLLKANLERLVVTLRAEGIRFEVIAVSDGSTDGSVASIADLDPAAVRCITLPRNCGKGEALRVGLAEGRGRYLGFIDADGDLDPEQWHAFLELMRLYDADVVLGSKRHPLSEVSYPPLRRMYSWGYQQLVRMLFRLRVRDTQTGIKLIRREVLADVLPRTVERRFAFDLELFVVARRCGWRRFLEAPVRIEHRFHSTVSPRAVVRTLVDTLGLAWRLHVRGAYDTPVPASSPVVPSAVMPAPAEAVA